MTEKQTKKKHLLKKSLLKLLFWCSICLCFWRRSDIDLSNSLVLLPWQFPLIYLRTSSKILRAWEFFRKRLALGFFSFLSMLLLLDEELFKRVLQSMLLKNVLTSGNMKVHCNHKHIWLGTYLYFTMLFFSLPPPAISMSLPNCSIHLPVMRLPMSVSGVKSILFGCTFPAPNHSSPTQSGHSSFNYICMY